MKINKFLAVALAATTLLASCTKEKTQFNGEEQTVLVKIDRSSANTRAVGSPVDTDDNGTEAVVFNSGYLVFTNASKDITRVITVSNDDAAYVESTSVGIQTLEGATGVAITAVPGNSTNVYFLGNVGTAPLLNANISDYTQTVDTQDDATGGVSNVSLYGAAALVHGATAGVYTATFDVAPIAARFEIAKIEGKAVEAASGVTMTYKVAGIFIDNYYNKMTWTGTGSELKENGATASYYVEAATGSSYTTALKTVVYDYNTAGLATETALIPATDKVWAYNLLAPTADTPEMPSIIIKLTDVVVGSASHGTQFLTISKFFTDAGKSTTIDKLGQGKIYVIDNIAFDEKDLTSDPYTSSITATVKVDMLDWESSHIGWEF
jgi:hypothetical protein